MGRDSDFWGAAYKVLFLDLGDVYMSNSSGVHLRIMLFRMC